MAMASQLVGPAFPFLPSVKGVLGSKTRRDSIRTSISLIITTPIGTVVYAPEFGSHIPSLVFDPLDDVTLNLISYYAVEDIERQDPRVKITSISVTHQEQHKVNVWLGYVDRDDEFQKQQQAPISFIKG